MMKRIKWPSWIMLIIFAFVIAIGVNKLVMRETEVAHSTKTKTSAVENNKRIKLADVIKIDNNSHDAISRLAEAALKADKTVATHIDDDLLEKALYTIDQWKWSIDQSYLTLYFDENEITKEAIGPVEAAIPINKIHMYLEVAFINELEAEIKAQIAKEAIKQEKVDLDPNGKYIALTFDDGPSPTVTPLILDILKKHDAKATFFMLGKQVRFYPEIVQEIAKDGHELGNHTMNHPDLTKLGIDQVNAEVAETNQIIKRITGITPTMMRPPYGAYNEDLQRYIGEIDMTMVLWSIDSLDWKSRNAIAVNGSVQKNMKAGSIILLHDIHQTTADALPKLLNELKAQDYQFVTVSQLLELQQLKGMEPFLGKLK